MANEIIMNNEVIETTEELVTSSGNGWKIAGGVGLLALAGFGLYKGGKWIAAKIKAKKEQKAASEVETEACDAE